MAGPAHRGKGFIPDPPSKRKEVVEMLSPFETEF
jgi:hypothetical protein